MSDGGLGGVIGPWVGEIRLVISCEVCGRLHLRLRLGNVDNGTRHAPNKNHATLSLPLHKVLRDLDGEEVGPVDVDGPEAAHAVGGVLGGGPILGEAGGGDEGVYFFVRGEDVGDAGGDGGGIGYISVVGCDTRGGSVLEMGSWLDAVLRGGAMRGSEGKEGG